MITLNWKWFDRPIVFQALKKIATTGGMPAETSYKAGRIIGEINKQMGEAREVCLGILRRYTFIDPLTNLPKGFPNGPYTFLESDSEKLHDAEFGKVMLTEFSIKASKLPVSDLEDCRLNPEEMMAIDDILDAEPKSQIVRPGVQLLRN